MFDWSKFLDLARRLRSGDEADVRTAISRAYYAAFHQSRSFCESWARVSISRGPDDHKLVINGLKNFSGGGSNADLVRKAGRDLGSLHSARIKADYVDDFGGLVNEPGLSIKRAEDVGQFLGSYKPY